MASSRLTESQKRNIVDGYRDGHATSSLAKEFGCSVNTITRTVKGFLSNQEYISLKAARSKGGTVIEVDKASHSNNPNEIEKLDLQNIDKLSDIPIKEDGDKSEEIELNEQDSRHLALNDADDFGEDSDDDFMKADSDFDTGSGVFQEVVPLTSAFDLGDSREVICKPFKEANMPETVFVIVDKTVELEAHKLKDLPELGLLHQEDEEKKAIYMFSNIRNAKRSCGRNNRVIKIPDSSILKLSIPFLIDKGISRILLEGSLFSIED